MNRSVTSREELLAAAREIVASQGADQLNIRSLAQSCGIATGSVYNYFTGKSELLLALVEDFWKTVFHSDVSISPAGLPFPDLFEQVFTRMSLRLRDFRQLFARPLGGMDSGDKARGKQLEQTHLNHIHSALVTALLTDPGIRKDLWSDSFRPEQFVSFVFDNMMRMLIAGQEDCGYLRKIIVRLIY